MSRFAPEPGPGPRSRSSRRAASLEDRWALTRERFLAAVDPRQRAAVAELLRQPRRGGQGLRVWLQSLATRGVPVPRSLPPDLVGVYLQDAEALPLHDCAGCGLAVPVRPGRGGEGDEPEQVYFPHCPCCGAATGLYAYWAGPRSN